MTDWDKIERIVHFGTVSLKWDKISIEGFDSYQIERKPTGTNDWEFVAEIENRLLTQYTNRIYDDESLDYRVGIIDKNGSIRWAEATTDIPHTRQVYVPSEKTTISGAINDPLIDDIMT